MTDDVEKMDDAWLIIATHGCIPSDMCSCSECVAGRELLARLVAGREAQEKLAEALVIIEKMLLNFEEMLIDTPAPEKETK